jgi:hypothetical protein
MLLRCTALRRSLASQLLTALNQRAVESFEIWLLPRALQLRPRRGNVD